MKTVVSLFLRLAAWITLLVYGGCLLVAILAVSPLVLVFVAIDQAIFGPFALLDEINNREDFLYRCKRDDYLLVWLWQWSNVKKEQ